MFWLGSFKVPILIPASTRRYSEVSLETALGSDPAYLAREQIARKAKELERMFSFILHNRSVTILKSENNCESCQYLCVSERYVTSHCVCALKRSPTDNVGVHSEMGSNILYCAKLMLLTRIIHHTVKWYPTA